MIIKLFGYQIEIRFGARWPWTHMKLHRRGYYNHFIWGKLSLIFGQIQHCEECQAESEFDALCQKCYERNYCECGQRLEDMFGSPGDGLCRRCD